jgi:hypothetical protein
LAQWFVKGWRVVVMTPKLLDPILTPYAAHHQVLTGITDDDLAACVDVWDELRTDRTHRQKLQAEHGVRRWADMPAEVLAEYPLLAVVWDESRSFFMSHPGETQERKKLKAACLAAWNELVQEGRSAGHHGLIVTQSANVESLGGGFAAEQLGMVCAVRSLPRKWWPVVFPETTADVLAEYPLLIVVLDESRSFFMSHPGETQARKKLKAACLAAWNELVQEGRSAGHHGLIVTQSANVESLGGGFAAEQLGMVCAVRSLPRKWWPVVFPETTSDITLLANPTTVPGRAVARGLATPKTLFGSVAVNDAPMQLPLMDDATRDALLDGSTAWGVPADVVEAVELTPVVEAAPVERLRPGVVIAACGAALWFFVLLVGLVASL